MQLAKIMGRLESTRKTNELQEKRMLMATPIDVESFEPKGEPFVIKDTLGACEEDIIVYSVGDASSAAGCFVLAIVDSVEMRGAQVYSRYIDEEPQDTTSDDICEQEEEPVDLDEDVVGASDEATVVAETIAVDETVATVTEDMLPETQDIEETDQAVESMRRRVAQQDTQSMEPVMDTPPPNAEELVEEYLSEETRVAEPVVSQEQVGKPPQEPMSRVQRFGRKRRKQ